MTVRHENRLELVFPTAACRELVRGYGEEFAESGDSMDGGAGYEEAESFEAWLAGAVDARDGKNLPSGYVPATVYLAIERESGRMVGIVQIRHRLNDALLLRGGHIGYSVRRSERRKGYATEMLALALEKCGEMGIGRALVTCAKTNLGSAGAIRNNGGVLENEVEEPGRITQRYWLECPAKGE